VSRRQLQDDGLSEGRSSRLSPLNQTKPNRYSETDVNYVEESYRFVIQSLA